VPSAGARRLADHERGWVAAASPFGRGQMLGRGARNASGELGVSVLDGIGEGKGEVGVGGSRFGDGWIWGGAAAFWGMSGGPMGGSKAWLRRDVPAFQCVTRSLGPWGTLSPPGRISRERQKVLGWRKFSSRALRI
jgi:hypothetical protein